MEPKTMTSPDRAPPQPDDAERLARLRRQRDEAPTRYQDGVALAPMVNFQWIEVDFLFQQLDASQSALAESQQKVESLTIKSPRELAMRETIHGQGLSMVAMGKELREKDKALADIVAESVGRLNALAESRAEVARLQSELDKTDNELETVCAAWKDADEARRRAIIEAASDRAFGPDR